MASQLPTVGSASGVTQESPATSGCAGLEAIEATATIDASGATQAYPTISGATGESKADVATLSVIAPTAPEAAEDGATAGVAVVEDALSDTDVALLLGAPPILPDIVAVSPQATRDIKQHRAAVLRNPRSFDDWLKLTKAVEQGASFADIKATYVAFLHEFPLCWGYWKRLSELEARENGLLAAITSYERAVSVAALCVDLWICYCDLLVNASKHGAREGRPSPFEVRAAFERAIAAAGLDWRSGPLWLKYLDFEESHGEWAQVGNIFRRAIGVPMDDLGVLHKRFCELLTTKAVLPLEQLCAPEDAHLLAAVEVEQQALPAAIAPAATQMPGQAIAGASASQWCGSGPAADSAVAPGPMAAAVAATMATSAMTSIAMRPPPPPFPPIPSAPVPPPPSMGQQTQCRPLPGASHEPLAADDDELEDGEILEERGVAPPPQHQAESPPAASIQGEAVPPPKPAAEPFAAAAAVFRAATAMPSGSAVDAGGTGAAAVEDVNFDDSVNMESLPRARGRRWLLRRWKVRFDQMRIEVGTLREFETQLKRSYFHDSPLSAAQVESWRCYLDMEESRLPRDDRRTCALFGRCLVVANNYVEFWLRYARLWEHRGDLEGARQLLESACSCGRLRGQADAIAALAELEEQCGRPRRARALLDALLAKPAGRANVELPLGRVAMDLRADDHAAAEAKLRSFMEAAPAADPTSSRALLTRRYAQLCECMFNKPTRALEAFKQAWQEGCRDPNLVQEFAALKLRLSGYCAKELAESVELFEEALEPSSLANYTPSEACELWTCYVDFLVAHGAPIGKLRSAQARARSFAASMEALPADPLAALMTLDAGVLSGAKRQAAPADAACTLTAKAMRVGDTASVAAATSTEICAEASAAAKQVEANEVTSGSQQETPVETLGAAGA